MLAALFLSVCATVAGQKNVYTKLLGETSYFQDPSHVQKFLGNLRKLSTLQTEILGLRPTSFDEASFDVEPKNPEQLPYLFEGDLILTESQMDAILKNAENQLKAAKNGEPKRHRRSMTSSLYSRWSNAPIPYYINTGSGVSESAVLAGIARWEADTCIRFTRQYSIPSGNGIEFFLGSGCYSMVGKVGSRSQQVSIGYGCTSLGTVTHEIGHALGFYHEQGRYDRDSYVSIVSSNIQNGYLSQFTKQDRSTMEDYGVGYDYGSVMHYDQFSFSASGRNTIQTIDTNYQQTIGQRDGPSFMDVKRINLAYCNSTCGAKLPCLNGGYTDPKNCAACRCPSGFGGTLCDRAAVNPSQCESGDLSADATMKTLTVRGAVSCSFVIKAPSGRRIYFEVPSFTFTAANLCQYNFLEIKYAADLQRAGARFCLSPPRNSYSEGDTLVVIYRGSSYTSFTLNYRYDPPTAIAPTPPAPTTTTPRPTAATTTTQRTTTRGNPYGCTAWSACSFPCGGCGVSRRTCNGVTQAVYCNKQPCNFNFCCQPFLYVNQGYCFHPYYSDGIINEEERLKLFGEYENKFSGEGSGLLGGSGEMEGSEHSEGNGLTEGSGSSAA